jgi:polyribonucleotide nucleotidyltransferase
MDFKVAGTRTGITALQMDIKISGITSQIMREALEQARRGRLFLLDTMDAHLSGPRTEKSKHAPQIRTLQIPVDKIRDLIGPGGKVIRGIIESTGVKIDVEDTGRVSVASSDAEGLAKALEIIGNLTAVPEVGKTYLGKVVRLAEFGAFVELFPGTDGLLHISEIAEHRVKEVKDELNEGDQVLVRVLGIEGNRIKLSRKALLREQRQKLGLPEPGAAVDIQGSAGPAPRSHAPIERQPSSNASTITIEGGDDFDEEGGDEFEGEDEPNFNRIDGTPVPVGAGAGGRRRSGGRGRGPGGPGGGNRGPR